MARPNATARRARARARDDAQLAGLTSEYQFWETHADTAGRDSLLMSDRVTPKETCVCQIIRRVIDPMRPMVITYQAGPVREAFAHCKHWAHGKMEQFQGVNGQTYTVPAGMSPVVLPVHAIRQPKTDGRKSKRWSRVDPRKERNGRVRTYRIDDSTQTDATASQE